MRARVKGSTFWTEIGEIIEVPDDYVDGDGKKWDAWVQFPDTGELVPFSFDELEIVE